jgi:hypothetical protein
MVVERGSQYIIFHHVANGKRRKQNIFFLNNGDEVISGNADLMNHITEY